VKEIADHIVRILSANGYEASGLGVTSDVAGALSELRARKPAAVFILRIDPWRQPLRELAAAAAGAGENPLHGLRAILPWSLALRKEKVKEILRARGGSGAVRLSGFGTERVARCELVLSRDCQAGARRRLGWDHPGLGGQRSGGARRACSPYPRPLPSACPGRGVHRGARDLRGPCWARVGGELQVFPFFEIDFSAMPPDRPKIVSFEGKWVEDSVEYKGTRPIRCEGLSPELREQVAQTALDAFRCIGLRDYGRMDIRLHAGWHALHHRREPQL